MAWRINRVSGLLDTYRVVTEDGLCVAEITEDRESWHKIVFSNLTQNVRDLNTRLQTKEECYAYVRGVEATVKLYGKETGR